ncbi:hypothetical protein BDV36DRAFT_245632 [Aspergillus pseudocaelatus]|uniref:Secreted protein n=1 Tax=Aspergillus pseudocaelatus TaxID=1825620 RepID=A0ABQ6WZ61_9EURO|nr:hypothetical protein BDV36DRAFT_245632 [Aspergillus pseudocaelatus]
MRGSSTQPCRLLLLSLSLETTIRAMSRAVDSGRKASSCSRVNPSGDRSPSKISYSSSGAKQPKIALIIFISVAYSARRRLDQRLGPVRIVIRDFTASCSVLQPKTVSTPSRKPSRTAQYSIFSPD